MFSILVVITILTYIIPSGEYSYIKDNITDEEFIDPKSFEYVEKNEITIMDMFRSIPRGMIEGAKIIASIFIISGTVQIMSATGAINIGIMSLAKKFKGRENFLIPVIMLAISSTGAFLGFSESNIVFIPLTVSLAQHMGYDPIVGMCMVYLANQIGHYTGVMNPTNVGIAQEMAGLPIFSATGFRFILWIVFLSIAFLYVLKYAKKVKENPELSLVSDITEERKLLKLSEVDVTLTIQHKLVFLVLVVGLVIIVYGASNYQWGIVDISAIFLMVGIISGIIGKFSPTRIATEFIAGAESIVFGALIVGFARAIAIVMTDSLIIHTVVHSLVNLISILPRSLQTVGIYLMQWIINIFIPSSSGQASVVMPIMIPLGDVLNINRQVSVLAFHLGDGINGCILPTSSTLLATCSIAGVPYDRWVKFVWKLVALFTILGGIAVVIANVINLGPF